MTSRQRLLEALSGKIPDRVPISTYELSGYNSKSFENIDPSYAPLMELIRKNTDTISMWNPDSDERCFQTAFAANIQNDICRQGDTRICRSTLETPKGQLTRTTKQIDGIYTTWQVEHWCKDTDDIDKAMSLPYAPLTYDNVDFNRIRSEVGDNGLVMTTIEDPFCSAIEMMEFGEATVWVMTETDHFQKTLDRIFERTMENLKRMLATNVVDLYRIVGAEYATPPYMPPEMFSRFVAPYVAKISDLIHSYGAKTRIHSHGRIGQVLDDIIKTGVDGIDPCEAPPDGDILLADVKHRTNNQICLFGNIQLKLLEHGTRQQVREEVIRAMDAAKAGGNFVIMPTAAPINTPISLKTQENYEEFIRAALEFGVY